MEKIQILITTYQKSELEAIDIVKNSNIFCDCIIRNQCGRESIKEHSINGHKVLYVEADDVGLSKNRNELLKLATSEFVLYLDDDCAIKKIDFHKLIEYSSNFDLTFCECISLNNDRPLPHLTNHKNNNKFRYFSGCGIVGCIMSIKFLRLHCIFFNENFGSGTKLLCGEDSVFINDVIKKGGNVGITKHLSIEVSQKDSLWYSDVLTSDYLFSKGFFYRTLHDKLWLLYGIRFLLLSRRKCRFFTSLKILIKGSKHSIKRAKVGVFTITDSNNYGNRLQNFALVYFLNSNFNNVDAKTFRYVCTEYSKIGYIKNFFRIKNGKNFQNFNDALPHIKKRITRGYNFDSFKNIDSIIVGSDQIWNENYFGPGIYTNMLEKCRRIRKFSYAVSVGNRELFLKKINAYYPLLKQFENLSFREIMLSDSIGLETSLRSTFNIDPVLLLKKDCWLSMLNTQDRSLLDKAFVHFLNTSLSSALFKGSEQTNKDKYLLLEDHCDPLDLVKNIYQSNHVFTDSYHVFIISLLLNRDITLFVRDGVSNELDDRFQSIITLFKLDYQTQIIGGKKCFCFDFSKLDDSFYKILNKERLNAFKLFESMLVAK